jgi:uncharacterized membrane protein YjgN (DUF898 family)
MNTNTRTTGTGIEAHRLKFSGGGGEYFRVWIVNVLLSIVTLGLYTPVARRRTARYFFDHTVVAGSPLEFAAQLRKMVLGFLIFVLLYLAFKIASNTGQTTAASLFILAAAVMAPYIWGSAMRFRLGNTRWRGLQLQFSASWKEVYLASWPIFAMAAVWVLVTFALKALAPDLPTPPPSAAPRALPNPAMALPQVSPEMWAVIALGVVLSVLCVIRLEFNYKSLLVLRGGIGDQRGRWKPVYSDFVKIWAATIGVFIVSVVLAIMLLALLVGVVVGGSMVMKPSMQSMGPAFALFILLAVVGGVFVMLVASAPARAYREARMFRLVWSNVGLSQVARFKCALKTSSFVLLRLKNLLLTLLTLGLYRPFARVSEYRMKTDSVTLHVKGGLDQLVGQLARQQKEGLGDALADAAGLDLIG